MLLFWQPRQCYGLSGGIVEPHETPPMAAVREAKEEIGVEIALEVLVGSYHLRGGGKIDMLVWVYRAHIVSGEPFVADPSEIARLEWVLPASCRVPFQTMRGSPSLTSGWANAGS